jgi:hypothetical protein
MVRFLVTLPKSLFDSLRYSEGFHAPLPWRAQTAHADDCDLLDAIDQMGRERFAR